MRYAKLLFFFWKQLNLLHFNIFKLIAVSIRSNLDTGIEVVMWSSLRLLCSASHLHLHFQVLETGIGVFNVVQFLT